MDRLNSIVQELEKWIRYLHKIKAEENKNYFNPIGEGKWSKAAIITHITFWDRFFLNERLPHMLEGDSLVGINKNQVEEMNKKAEEYAHSGKELTQLIDESIEQRQQIIHALVGQDLAIRYKIKGKEYSLEEYVKGEVEHDRHHIKQLENESS